MSEFKIMPHNLEAEQALLGCVLIDVQIQADILALIDPVDFYSESHQNIFKAMQAVYTKNIPVDFVTLADNLEKSGTLEKVGGLEYITILSNSVPSAVNYKFYLDIVKADSIKRKLIKSGQEIIEKAYSADDKQEVLNFAEKSVFDIADKQGSSSLEHVGKPGGAIKQVIDKFDTIANDPTSLRGIPTGFKEYDAMTNGLQNSDLVLLAARPGVGKTSFAMNIIVNSAIKHGKKCAVFSLEMSRAQLMQRAICSLAKVSMAKALNGTMGPEEWNRIWSATKQLEQSSIYIDDSSMTTPSSLISKCRQLKAKEGLDIIMVDYIQLMSSGKSRVESRQNEVSEISRNLKIAAKELNVPVIALSQLSRSVEQRQGDHRPVPSDLRDSGAIEQDADIILFLYNPEKYNDVPQEDEPGTIELIVSKHRNGRTGTVKLRWIGEYTTFVNLDERVNVRETQRVQSKDVTETPVEKIDNDVFGDDE
jgi:replicative DNA helicase